MNEVETLRNIKPEIVKELIQDDKLNEELNSLKDHIQSLNDQLKDKD